MVTPTDRKVMLGPRAFTAISLVLVFGALGCSRSPSSSAHPLQGDVLLASGNDQSAPGQLALSGDAVLPVRNESGPPEDSADASHRDAQPPADNVGLRRNDPRASQGYSLLAPMNSTETHLIDMEGRVVQTWKSDYTPALGAYLLENGHLLRTGADPSGSFFGPGSGGRIQEFSWEGELVWDFSFSTERNHPHHDICPMPNGNVLMIAWDKKTAKEAIAAGRRPESVGDHFRPDCIIEVQPTGKTTGKIVWEWRAWDHLIQDVDETKPNYGEVSEHPELIDINYDQNVMAAMLNDPRQLAQLRSLGYVGGRRPARTSDADNAPGPARGGRGPRPIADWMHVNSVDYNAQLDQIMLSVHSFHEVWIIDHGTTTEEAASHSGGRRGKGGDLLYRWGNPKAYRSGTNVDQRLFAHHNAHWIPSGLSGAGNMLVFNNGNGRPDGVYSSVDEVELPLSEDGSYSRAAYLAFGPDRATWSYSAPDKSSFYSMMISGAHRLPNGNTFVCSGTSGIVFEVTPEKDIVWEYRLPRQAGPGEVGPGPFGMDRGGLIPSILQGMLQMSNDQKEQLAKLQEEVFAKRDALLTGQQRKQLEDGEGGGPGGRRGFAPPPPGQVVPAMVVETLKLSDEQSATLAELQKQVDAKLGEIITEKQQSQLDEMQSFARSMFGARGFKPPPGFGPPGAGGRGPGGRRGRGFGGPGGGPGGPGGLFRSYRYAANFPGLAGRDLTPGEKLEELVAKQDEPRHSQRPQ